VGGALLQRVPPDCGHSQQRTNTAHTLQLLPYATRRSCLLHIFAAPAAYRSQLSASRTALGIMLLTTAQFRGGLVGIALTIVIAKFFMDFFLRSRCYVEGTPTSNDWLRHNVRNCRHPRAECGCLPGNSGTGRQSRFSHRGPRQFRDHHYSGEQSRTSRDWTGQIGASPFSNFLRLGISPCGTRFDWELDRSTTARSITSARSARD